MKEYLYVSVNDPTKSIYKVDETGASTLVTNTNLSSPSGIAFDINGNFYVANTTSNAITKYNQQGIQQPFTYTGTTLNGPIGLAFDTQGNLFVANYVADQIIKIVINGSTGTGSVFTASNIHTPYGLAFDSSGNLYVSNFDGAALGKITKYNSSGAQQPFTYPAFPELIQPEGITFDSSGNLYTTDRSTQIVKKFAISGSNATLTSSLSLVTGLPNSVAMGQNNVLSIGLGNGTVWHWNQTTNAASQFTPTSFPNGVTGIAFMVVPVLKLTKNAALAIINHILENGVPPPNNAALSAFIETIEFYNVRGHAFTITPGINAVVEISLDSALPGDQEILANIVLIEEALNNASTIELLTFVH